MGVGNQSLLHLGLFFVIGLAVFEDLAGFDVGFCILAALRQEILLVTQQMRLDVFEVAGEDIDEPLLELGRYQGRVLSQRFLFVKARRLG